ncbi:MAG: putative quinone oxidoreductase [Acidimicrobiia bacterium]|nr:putative quinone oxidoreductase [Acidimicrobiia bacterium]
MRAVVIDTFGGPEVLRIVELSDPAPGPEEVLVEVVATALNRADLLQRRGHYPGPPEARDIPGMEFSGRVVALGERASRWSVGDSVMGIVGGGAYAEKLVIHERQAIAVPSAVAVADAAAIPEVFITAWDAMVVQGGLTSGRHALVHAGASGVGTAAIQLAAALGARVAVTASAGKLDRCRALGADLATERSPADWAAEIAKWAPAGVDVVLDVVGEVAKNVAVLRVGGRIVQVGAMGPSKDPFSVASLIPKRASIIGTSLRPRPLEEKIAVSRRFETEIVPLFADGRLKPIIDCRYPLSQIVDAHRHMESNSNVGKILIDLA